MPPRPERPPESEYYERDRVELFSQGDLFRDVPLADVFARDVVKESALNDLRRFDHLINYMYLPPLDVPELEFAMPESVALLYMPVTLHHAFLEGQRVSQLAYRGAQQLQRKLVWFYSGWLEDDLDTFEPPMD
jgi:hypothetical protein